MLIAQETLRLIKLHPGVVVGLDVSDDALLGDSASIISILPELRELGIPVALHLGECSEETEAQQMMELEQFQPSRIGHGVFLTAPAKEWIFARRLPIEMCLSSAVQAHMVTNAMDHPALALLRSGYPVVVCTDDPLVFCTTHSEESELARQLLQYSVEEMAELHVAALKFKFSAI